MQAAITHILPLTLVRRRRVLPSPGRVLVTQGQKISSAVDVVAELDQPGSHAMVDVRRALGLSRIDQAEGYINRHPGEAVKEGDVLALTGGFFARSVRSPVSGLIVAISAGRLLIETNSAPLQIQAGISGVVTEVIPDYGAVIETHGVLVQGWFGNGRVDQGTLLALAQSADDEITAARLDVSMRGAVVLAGSCSQADVIRSAADLPLRGLIFSSITADLIPLARQAPYPIIVLEGFGKIPFDREAYQILATNEKRDICVNAAAYDPYTGERPELVVPLPAVGNLPVEAAKFTVGQNVRILSAPYNARVGVLAALHPGLFRFSNGILAPAGDVRLEDNQVVTVPLANLDVLE